MKVYCLLLGLLLCDVKIHEQEGYQLERDSSQDMCCACCSESFLHCLSVLFIQVCIILKKVNMESLKPAVFDINMILTECKYTTATAGVYWDRDLLLL